MLKRTLERSRRKLWYGPIRVEGVQVMIPLVPENPGSSNNSICERLALRSSKINTGSSPNVEYGKMRSEPDECFLGADFRVIDSTFYFS
jgi:hypothetical protein